MALDFPANPSNLDVHNATNGLQYVFDGVKWVAQGSYTTGTINAQKLDNISSTFNGVLTTFNLKVNNKTVKPASAESVHIVLGGHLQEPLTAYTINTLNGTITFATAPTNGTAFFGVVLSRLPINDTIGTGTIRNVNIAGDAAIDGTKINPDFGNNSITGITATQSANDNTTKLASTAFVQTAISNLIDSSPDALNTLNELAAALGDDANFSTTITNALAAKAPLSSPTFTGTVSGVSYDDLDNLPTGAELTTAITSTEFTESVQDIVGAMVTGNTETGITVTYNDGGDGTGKLNFATSDTNTTTQTFSDNAKAIFGTNGDGLEIYHDSSNSIIDDNGTGALIIYGSDIIFQKHVDSGQTAERMADFAQDGAVRLYFDGINTGNPPNTIAVAKFETTANGVKINGGLQDKDGELGTNGQVLSSTGTELNWVDQSSYTLPTADGSTLGGIKVGTNLSIDSNGVLSATQLSLTTSNINAAFGDTAQLILGAADGDGDDALKLFYGPITSGGTQYGVLTADTGLQLQFDGSTKLTTESAGVKWIGDLFADAFTNSGGGKIKMGPNGALQIYHDNSNSIIDDTGTGGLLIYGSDIILLKHNSSSRMADFAQDGAVRLYENGTERLATTDVGISVSGNIVVSGTVDSRDLQTDGTKLDGIAANANNYSLPTAASNVLGGIKVGTNLSIDNNGVLSASQLTLTASAVNDLYGDNGNLILGTGSGDDTLKLYYDGTNAKITSDNAIHLQQNGANKLEISSSGVKWIGDLFCDDLQKIKLGSSADLQIYHDNSGSGNSIIEDSGAGALLIYGSDIIIQKSGSSSRMADFAQDGAVRLYESGTIRLTTTNAGVDVSGNIVVSGNVDGRDVAADGTKLDGIESGATADQTAAEIRSLVESASDSNVFTDADHTKLNSIGANANNYSLPIATNSVLGGIKVGNNLSIDSSTGVLSASASAPTASTINDLYPDNGNLILGTGSGNDTLKLYYDGTNAKINSDNAIHLQQNGANKLEVVSSGVKWIGDLFCDDNQHLKIGSSADLDLHHDQTNSYIDNGEGALNIRLLSNATSIQLIAGSDYMARFVKNGTVQLYWDHNLRLETASSGVKWFGDLFCDSDNRLKIGNSAALQIYHDSTSNNSFITEGGSGSLVIKATNTYINAANDQAMIAAIAGGAVTLYHANSAKIATTSSGVSVTGNIGVSGTVDGRDIASDGSKLDGIASNANNYSLPTASASTLGGIKVGSNLSISNGVLSASASGGGASGFDFNDNVRIKFGADDDLQLFHDTNNSVIDATGTGGLLLYAADIILHEKSNASHVIAKFSQDSSTGCQLYYDNSLKLQTTSSGLTISGNIAVTGTVDGRDVASDGSKLDGIAASANNYSLPTASSSTLGGIKVGTNLSISNGVLSATDTNTTYSVGDGGLTQKNFTTTLKNKLDGIAANANNYSFPYTISQSASNGTVVRRNDSGYIFANYFNTSPNDVTSGVTKVCVETSNDGYIRHGTPAAIRSFINVADGANNYSFPYTISASASNNTVVLRHSSGYIFSNYINTTDNSVTGSISAIMCKQSGQGDYHRSATAGAVRAFINVENGATADQTASDINNLYPDNGQFILGTGGGSDTMKMYYNGSVGVITANGGVYLQHDGGNKIHTNSTGVRIDDRAYFSSNSIYLRATSGQFGSVSCHGAIGGYAGFSIDGRVVFMHNGGTTWGLYNDVNNHWLMVGTLSGNTEIRHANSTKILVVNFGAIIYGTIRPHQHNGGDCGAGDARWGTVYASNGSINTSDRNEKNSILEADLGLDFINKLNPVSYKWNDPKLGTKTRYGLIAQDIEETIKEVGKDVNDLGMIDKPEEGPMGLNYSELIAPLVKAVQELSARVAVLEGA